MRVVSTRSPERRARSRDATRLSAALLAASVVGALLLLQGIGLGSSVQERDPHRARGELSFAAPELLPVEIEPRTATRIPVAIGNPTSDEQRYTWLATHRPAGLSEAREVGRGEEMVPAGGLVWREIRFTIDCVPGERVRLDVGLTAAQQQIVIGFWTTCATGAD